MTWVQMDSKFEYKILDKMPIGLCYTLIMHYLEYTAHQSRCTPYLHVCSSGNCYQSQRTSV